MNEALLIPILTAAFAAAFLHAVLPTHWLPFVLVGRGQGWSHRQTLGAAALSGLAHVAVTVVVGIAVVAIGMEIDQRFNGALSMVSAAILAVIGLYFLLTRKKGARAAHDQAEAPARRYASDRAALWSLVAVLAFYPSEAFLPLYLRGAEHGWSAFVVLSVILLVATLGGMMLFTSLALAGASRLKLERWERYERVVLAVVLFALAAMILLWRP